MHKFYSFICVEMCGSLYGNFDMCIDPVDPGDHGWSELRSVWLEAAPGQLGRRGSVQSLGWLRISSGLILPNGILIAFKITKNPFLKTSKSLGQPAAWNNRGALNPAQLHGKIPMNHLGLKKRPQGYIP